LTCYFFSATELCIFVVKWFIITIIHCEILLTLFENTRDCQNGARKRRVDYFFYLPLKFSRKQIGQDAETLADITGFALEVSLVALTAEARNFVSHLSLTFKLLAFV
jgi:hypothetical protein